MDFESFKSRFQHAPVIEYPNDRADKSPLVTVRVISYNHAPFVAKCLDSILMQETTFDFEILIAEDESNDGTRDICIEYAKKHPDRIRLLLNSRQNNIHVNGKPTGLFGSCYSKYIIQSKYIALIESDDYWTDPQSLQKRVSFLEENDDFVMCFHNSVKLDSRSNTMEKKPMLPFESSISIEPKDIFKHYIPTASVVHRHGLIAPFEEGLQDVINSDAVLFGKLSHFGKGRFIHDIQPMVRRIHDGGIFGPLSTEEKFDLFLQARLYLLQYSKENNLPTDHIEEELAIRLLKYCLNIFLSSGRLKPSLLRQSRKFARAGNLPFRKVMSTVMREKFQRYLFRKSK